MEDDIFRIYDRYYRREGNLDEDYLSLLGMLTLPAHITVRPGGLRQAFLELGVPLTKR